MRRIDGKVVQGHSSGKWFIVTLVALGLSKEEKGAVWEISQDRLKGGGRASIFKELHYKRQAQNNLKTKVDSSVDAWGKRGGDRVTGISELLSLLS